MDSKNIGKCVKELLFRTSQGLQGKTRNLEEAISEAEKQIKKYKRCIEAGGIFSKYGNEKETFHPFENTGSKVFYAKNLLAWKKRKKIIEKGGQGLIAKEERELYLNLGDFVQNEHFLIFAKQQYKTEEDKRNHNSRNWERIPGIYDMYTWFSQENIIDNCKKHGLALPPLGSYNRIKKLEAIYQEKEKAASEGFEKLEARLDELGISLFDSKKIKKDFLAKKLDLESQKLSKESRIAEKNWNNARDMVYIFKELNESQIHFYGNAERNIPCNYKNNVTPITAKNLGEELNYVVSEFLKNYPKGANSMDLSLQSLPFVIQSKNGIYSIRLNAKGPFIFQDLTLAEIIKLTK